MRASAVEMSMVMFRACAKVRALEVEATKKATVLAVSSSLASELAFSQLLKHSELLHYNIN